ncbi:OmpA family protein [Izhakiella capsodis]|uniref:OmpA family protein n=1 Tax=Izhakiella capsodis TaxID=1367852 RepID=A0A1I5A1J3_9GAMM|nr:OmpA family protein [Izhakiella capsodis]SFN56385.1 OmpA family protein [Izhakiella capsodis]
MKKKIFLIALIAITFITLLTFFLCLLFPHFMPEVMTPLMLTAMVATIAIQCQYQLQIGKRQISEQCSESSVKPENPVILLIGPCAATWFSKSDATDNARYAGSATWLQIGTPQELEKRLNYLNQYASNAPVHAFFPFLPDDSETVELTIKKIRAWQERFRSTLTSHCIPCTFAIYTRLSSERRSHSPDNATWSDDLAIQPRTSTNFAQALNDLELHIQNRAANDCNHSQRKVVTLTLLGWIKVSGISQAISDVFSRSSLELNKILLCDYGNGFTRHGAWSNWLESQYAILPSLGTGITLPPLPPVTIPIKKMPVIVRKKTQIILPKLYWSILLVTTLLAVKMFSHARYEYQQNMAFEQLLQRCAAINNLSIHRLEKRINYLDNEYQRRSQQVSSILSLQWSFIPESSYSNQLLSLMTKLKSIPVLSTAGAQEIFNSGSAALLPAAAKQLKNILMLARKYPNNNLLIVGHSDDTGRSDYNLLLSKKRAISVRNWLLEKNIAPQRLKISAAGDSEPVSNNSTPAGRQHNRRIEILIVPPEIMTNRS